MPANRKIFSASAFARLSSLEESLTPSLAGRETRIGLAGAASDGHAVSNIRKLLTLPGSTRDLRFSPDDTRLRFSVVSSQDNVSIWEVRSDGSDLHRVLPGWSAHASVAVIGVPMASIASSRAAMFPAAISISGR
jgi:hypothetical protein